MFINQIELQSLAKIDSKCIDKEGYLFVKQRNDRLFNQWKNESFIERFCRLKGNLLLIISIKTLNDDIDNIIDRCIHLVILEHFTIKPIDETKYYGFIIEFAKTETIRCFYFATISHHERDEWIQAIHLSSFTYMRSLYQTLLNELKKTDTYTGDDENDTNLGVNRSQKSLILSLSCDHLFLNNSDLEPNLVIFVYFRTFFKYWKYLGKTEIVISRNPQFNKCLSIPLFTNDCIELKFSVYDVIEKLSFTRCLLAQTNFIIDHLNQLSDRLYKLDLISLINYGIVGSLNVKVNLISSKFRCIKRHSSLYPTVYSKYENNRPLNHCLYRSVSVPNNICFNTSNDMSISQHFPDCNLFMNTIHKSFQFSIHRLNAIAFIDEFMSESQYSFVFPQILMNIFMSDEKKLMNCITYSIGEVQTEWQRSQMRALESHLRLVNVLTESLNKLSQYQTQNNFRPSIAKCDLFLQFVPINFHLQRCLVSDTSRKLFLDIFTVGAFCCHYLGFANGGLKNEIFNCANCSNQSNISDVWRAMKDFLKIATFKDLIEQYLDRITKSENVVLDIHLVFHYFNKIDDICKELITLLPPNQVDYAIAFCENVREKLDVITSNDYNNIASSFQTNLSLDHKIKTDITRTQSLPEYGEQQEYEPIELTHLNIRASLISMNSKLKNKNGVLSDKDLEPSIRKLRNAIESLYRTSSICYATEALKLERQQTELYYNIRLRRYMIFSQALSSLIIATMSKLNNPAFIQIAFETRSILAYHEVLLSCYAEEMGMLDDFVFAIQQINCCVKFIFENSVKQIFYPKIEGNSFNLNVTFPVCNLSTNVTSIECCVKALIFNVGINEYATLAETFGHVKLQDSINKESYSMLESYINRIFADDHKLLENMNALKSEIWSNRSKNVRIFSLAEQIIQSIDGIRITSCKSAKDRTAMAVTLEESRVCSKLFNLSELIDSQLIQKILDTLRSEGTRRENTRKNLGIAKYAFNSIQLLTFPKLYRAPAGTYSSVET